MGTAPDAGAPVGLIAGCGELPAIAARTLRAAGHRVVAVGFDDETRDALAGLVDEYHALHLGQVERLIRAFRDAGVASALLLGKVHKARAFSDFRPDLRAVRIWMSLADRRDDTILRAVVEELAREGVAVAEAGRWLAPLFAPAGRLSRRAPTREELADVAFGLRLAREIGRLDIGQTVVVRHLAPVAVEALEGTDLTIRRAGEVAGPGTVVVKTAKPAQDMRFDVPTVGVETARSVVAARAAVLAIEAGRTLFLQREETLALLDAHGVALWGCGDADAGA
ncbi:MAG TPA: UDP-2,3-diacylglucosamine diphosphatase LpxI [bacterium]